MLDSGMPKIGRIHEVTATHISYTLDGVPRRSVN